MSKKLKNRQTNNFLIATGGIMFIMAMALSAGKKASGNSRPDDSITAKIEKYQKTFPNYADSIRVYDEKTQPRVNYLQNKIRAAESEEEIDYTDFRELIEISAKRDSLKAQKAAVDARVRQYVDSLMSERTR